MSPTPPPTNHDIKRFPRVSGDEPYGEMSDTDMAAFSPRERG